MLLLKCMLKESKIRLVAKIHNKLGNNNNRVLLKMEGNRGRLMRLWVG